MTVWPRAKRVRITSPLARWVKRFLGDGAHAERELFEWWSELIEVPVVAEGALTTALVESLAPVTDFFAIGPEIWGDEDPLARLRALIAPLD